MTATTESPTALLAGLDAAAKQNLLVALVQELIEAYHPDGVIPVTSGGRSLGYFVPPSAAESRAVNQLETMPPHVRASLLAPFPPDFDPDATMSDDEERAMFSRLRAGRGPSTP